MGQGMTWLKTDASKDVSVAQLLPSLFTFSFFLGAPSPMPRNLPLYVSDMSEAAVRPRNVQNLEQG